jgi:hypothetical protein
MSQFFSPPVLESSLSMDYTTMRILLCLICFAISGFARSQDYAVCVDTVAELEDAVILATVSIPFSRVIVRVEQGTYNLSASPILRTTAQQPLPLIRSLQLLGGYTNGCAARTLNASNTILQNTGAKRLEWLVKRDLKIQGFHFTAFANPIDLVNFEVEETEQQIDFSNNLLVGGSGQIDIGVQAGSDTSLITFKNNEIFGRQTDTNCSLRILGDSAPDTTARAIVSNNTFAGNGNGGADTLCLGSVDLPSFYNNIFYTNSGDDLAGIGFSNGPVTSANNIYQSVDSDFTFAVNSNNNSGNPLFVDYPAGDLRLQTTSPAANSGTSSVPFGVGSFDVAGKTRVIGTTIDRGAHESNNSGLFLLSVTNTNNAGAGSLRDAIVAANSTPGLNGIVFNIPGAGCPKIINLTSSLPGITDSLVIDGGTQPGSVANTSDIAFNGTRCVLLRGPGSGIGLQVPGGAPASTQLVVDSLVFGGFDFSVFLSGGRDHIVRGSHFGVNLGGGSNAGIIGVFISGPNDVQIGGNGPDERNVFARQVTDGTLGAGLLIGETSLRTEVINNYFGTEPNGVLPAENSYGIISDGDDGQYSENLIANSTETAIWLREDARNNLVNSSRIGLPVVCFGSCPNTSSNRRGMEIDGSANRTIQNEIAFSQSIGVRVTGNDNALSKNRVYGGGFFTAPIDIAGIGFTANDNDAAPTLPAGNRGINYPLLTKASFFTNPRRIEVEGVLQSSVGNYSIDFYASDRRLGGPFIGIGFRCEGQQYLGSTGAVISTSIPGVNGAAAFSASFDADVAIGRYITAQAVRKVVIDGQLRLADSSEYGDCLDAPFFADGFE